MGYRHSRDEIVAAAAAAALEHGIGALTYRRVAERLGISDRMVVYYLPNKTDLVLAATGALAASLQSLLDDAFGDEPRAPDELLREAWPVFTTDDADQVARIFFEIVGLATAGTAPFTQLATAILDGWVEWLSERVAAATPAARRRAALGIVARIDGLLLVRHVLGPEAADDAAADLAVISRPRTRPRTSSEREESRHAG